MTRAPEHLREAIEGSLKRLRLERIELYQLHAPDPVTPFDSSVETLAELRQQGKINMVGLSNVTREHVERARRLFRLLPCRIATASPIANGILLWTSASRKGLPLSRGSRWAPGKLLTMPCRRSRRLIP